MAVGTEGPSTQQVRSQERLAWSSASPGGGRPQPEGGALDLQGPAL